MNQDLCEKQRFIVVYQQPTTNQQGLRMVLKQYVLRQLRLCFYFRVPLQAGQRFLEPLQYFW